MLRQLLRAVSATPSQQPIEFIVSTFVVVTLAYFQVLHAFKTSEVAVPYSASSARLQPAYARLARANTGAPQWMPADEAQWIASDNKIDLVQLTFEPDVGPTGGLRAQANPANRELSPAVLDSVSNFSRSLCSTYANGQCAAFAEASPEYVYALRSPMVRPKFMAVVQDVCQQSVGQNARIPDLKYELVGESGSDVPAGDRWVGFAIRAMFARFWALAKVCHFHSDTTWRHANQSTRPGLSRCYARSPNRCARYWTVISSFSCRIIARRLGRHPYRAGRLRPHAFDFCQSVPQGPKAGLELLAW
jgi:hypothetical protein